MKKLIQAKDLNNYSTNNNFKSTVLWRGDCSCAAKATGHIYPITNLGNLTNYKFFTVNCTFKSDTTGTRAKTVFLRLDSNHEVVSIYNTNNCSVQIGIYSVNNGCFGYDYQLYTSWWLHVTSIIGYR